jgi:hypothetical protein
VALCLLFAACAPAAPTASAAASGPQVGSNPSGAPGASASPAASQSISGVPADWEKQWNDLIVAARQEGKLVFGGPPNPRLRSGLPAKFRERYGIDELPTLRTDLNNSWAPAYTLPIPGVQYHDDYGWDYVQTAFPESVPKIKAVMALR